MVVADSINSPTVSVMNNGATTVNAASRKVSIRLVGGEHHQTRATEPQSHASVTTCANKVQPGTR